MTVRAHRAIRRTGGLLGVANEGSAKVALNIQTRHGPSADPGRRQLRGGPGDAGMGAGRGLSRSALLIDHDDAEREFRYTSTAETFVES